MKLLKSTAIIAVAMTCLMTASASPVLLLNGDFESPVVPTGTYLSVGSVIPGWTVIGAGNVDLVNSPNPYWPGNTTQFMDLTGNTGSAGIQSDPFATTIGVTYEITFNALNGSLVYPGTAYTGPVMSVQASGSSLENYNGTTDLPAGTPEVLGYFFTATASSTTLSFLETSGFDSNASWIDNVSIQAVPEPSSAAVLALSALVLLGIKPLRAKLKKIAA